MSTTAPRPSAPGQADYEAYLRENWDHLPPYEQEVGRAYLLAKEQGALAAAPAFAPGGYAGYHAPAARPSEGTDLAVILGYIAPFVFTPAGIVLGVYNISKGRTGHGVAQIALSIGLIVVGVIAIIFLSTVTAGLTTVQ